MVKQVEAKQRKGNDLLGIGKAPFGVEGIAMAKIGIALLGTVSNGMAIRSGAKFSTVKAKQREALAYNFTR